MASVNAGLVFIGYHDQMNVALVLLKLNKKEAVTLAIVNFMMMLGKNQPALLGIHQLINYDLCFATWPFKCWPF